MVQRNLTTSS